MKSPTLILCVISTALTGFISIRAGAIDKGEDPKLDDLIQAATQREKAFSHYDCQMHCDWLDPGKDQPFEHLTYHWFRSDQKLFVVSLEKSRRSY